MGHQQHYTVFRGRPTIENFHRYGFVHPWGVQFGIGPSAFTIGGAEIVARNKVTANQSRHFFTVYSPFQRGLNRDNVPAGGRYGLTCADKFRVPKM